MLLLAAFIFISELSFADEAADAMGQRATQIVQKIESENLFLEKNWGMETILASNRAPSKKLILLRSAFEHTMWKESQDSILSQAKTYTDFAAQYGNARDRAYGKLITDFARIYDPQNLDPAYEFLDERSDAADWFIKHSALTFRLQIDIGFINANAKMQSATEALKLIPDDGSDYAIDAAISSLFDIAYLHSLLRNPELAVESYEKYIALSLEADRPVNGLSIVNNLIFAFGSWREHEITKTLVDVLIRLEEKTNRGVPGLTYRRAAQIYNDLGEHGQALEFAIKALEADQSPSQRASAELSYIVALLGSGRTQQGRRAYADYLATETPRNAKRTTLIREKLYIEALIALANGENATAVRLLNQRHDLTARHLLSTSNAQTTSMLASLQNSQDRRDEREQALERESQLRQVALDRQKRVNSLLMILAVILGTSAIVALTFARYRSRVAAQMSLAAEKAVAGDKAKSEFLAVMSHELRTPLNGILGLADFLSRTIPQQDIKDKMSIIHKSGQDLLALVENILDTTLLESGGIHPNSDDVNIRKIISKAEQSWREEIEARNILFTVHIDDTVPETVKSDPRRIAQCINNLLSNAAKFTMAGRIHIHVTSATDMKSGDVTLKIIVADTGVGMSEDTQENLFKPFVQADSSTTRHFGGAGLGLAITRNLARLLGGDVTFSTREGRGSEFILTVVGAGRIPAKKQTPLLAPKILSPGTSQSTDAQSLPQLPTELDLPIMQTPQGTHIRLPNIKILAVEDDLPSQDVLRTILAPTQCQLDCAGNAKIALGKLMQNAYDVILMDIRMPGMDGVTAVKRIRQSRQTHSNVPIIAVTADAAPETHMKCMAAGVDVFLTKPIRSEELLNAIEFVSNQNGLLETG